MQYYSVNQYCRDRFGEKLYKIALDGGFTCPVRDGKIDTRGCIFCDGTGSGSFAQSRNDSITEQLNRGKTLVDAKLPSGKEHHYIAYFQNFTGTYAPVDRLRKLYTEAINHPDVRVLSIATRPDCLPDEVISLLKEMNAIKPVWIELGLQTIHRDTAEWIRRGYELPVYEDAVLRLKPTVSHIITHMILGLPGETPDMMVETADYIGKSGVNGIKLQLLHVLRNTDLAALFTKHAFPVLTLEEYVDIVVRCLSVLPQDMVIHRITGDGNKRDLIAPEWSGNKKAVLNALNSAIHNA